MPTIVYSLCGQLSKSCEKKAYTTKIISAFFFFVFSFSLCVCLSQLSFPNMYIASISRRKKVQKAEFLERIKKLAELLIHSFIMHPG